MKLLKSILIVPAVMLIISSNLYAEKMYTLEAMPLKEVIKIITDDINLPYIVDSKLLEGKTSKKLEYIEGAEKALSQVLKDFDLEVEIKDDLIIIKESINRKKSDSSSLGSIDVIESSNITEDSGSYRIDFTNSSTGLNLSSKETPQSISVITKSQIDDIGASQISDALKSTNGISIKASDRQRNSVSARGFDIKNFQIDGTPTSTDNVGIETGSTTIYDHIEVVRGSTGLLNGMGNPSATINLVRKHANSKVFAGEVELKAGSYNNLGANVDVSTPLNEDGSVRARFIVSKSKSDSFMDLEKTENTLFYGIVDADLSNRTSVSIGASYQKNEKSGVHWGKLPYFYDDGSLTDFDRSKTSAADWNQWNIKEQSIFTNLKHHLSNNWILNASLDYYKQEEYSNLLWMTGDSIDSSTGLGLTGTPYLYEGESEQYQFDLSAAGEIELLDRNHEVYLGLSHTESSIKWYSANRISSTSEIGNFFNWDNSYTTPVWEDPNLAQDSEIVQTALLSSVRLNLNDNLKAIVGGRLMNWKRNEGKADWYDPSEEEYKNVFIPFLGLVYDINEQVSAYVSYASIFDPQNVRTVNGDYLDPVESISYEAGVKADLLDDTLTLTTAVYKTIQDNYAVVDGDVIVSGSTNQQAYVGESGVEVKGYEIEVAGMITPVWNISTSWSQFYIKSQDGSDITTRHPRKMLRLATKYSLAGDLKGLDLGASLSWQGDEKRYVENTLGNDVNVGESAFTLVNVMAKYKINKNTSVQLNIDNLFDKEYKESSWHTYTYGEPRKISTKITYKF